MRRIYWLVLILATATAVAVAASSARTVYVSAVYPPAQVSAAPAAKAFRTWHMATLNAPMTQGEQVRTGSKGAVEIELECGSALRLIPDSEFSFPRLQRDAKGVAETTVKVNRGSAFFTIRKNDSKDLRIEANGGLIAGWRGTTKLRVNVTGSKSASVELLDGQAQLILNHGAYRLPKASALVWSGDSTPMQDSASPRGYWYKWDQARDQLFERKVLDAKIHSPVLPMADAGYDNNSMAALTPANPYDPHAAAIFRPPDNQAGATPYPGQDNSAGTVGPYASEARKSMNRAAERSLHPSAPPVSYCAAY